MTETLLEYPPKWKYTTKKFETVQKPYSKKKPIIVESPLHIFCIDLNKYDYKEYLAGIDVFSKISYCDNVGTKDAATLNGTYLDMISLLSEAHILIHNGWVWVYWC